MGGITALLYSSTAVSPMHAIPSGSTAGGSDSTAPAREQWARGHKCPDKVPIHVMEELLEVLQLDDPPDPQHLSDSSSDDEVMLLASDSPNKTAVRRRTMRVDGLIGKRSILV